MASCLFSLVFLLRSALHTQSITMALFFFEAWWWSSESYELKLIKSVINPCGSSTKKNEFFVNNYLLMWFAVIFCYPLAIWYYLQTDGFLFPKVSLMIVGVLIHGDTIAFYSYRWQRQRMELDTFDMQSLQKWGWGSCKERALSPTCLSSIGSICGQTEQIKLIRALEMEWIVLDEKERFSGRWENSVRKGKG